MKIVPYILYSEILLRISKFCSPHFQSSFAHLVVEARIHLLPNLSDLCLYSSLMLDENLHKNYYDGGPFDDKFDFRNWGLPQLKETEFHVIIGVKVGNLKLVLQYLNNRKASWLNSITGTVLFLLVLHELLTKFHFYSFLKVWSLFDQSTFLRTQLKSELLV